MSHAEREFQAGLKHAKAILDSGDLDKVVHMISEMQSREQTPFVRGMREAYTKNKPRMYARAYTPEPHQVPLREARNVTVQADNALRIMQSVDFSELETRVLAQLGGAAKA